MRSLSAVTGSWVNASRCQEGKCWGEGEDATLRSRPSSPRCTNGGKTTGVAHPSSSSLQDAGLRRSLSIPRPLLTWRPAWDSTHCNRPRTEKRVTGLICNSFSVMTVCNPPLWEYSGDNPGDRKSTRLNSSHSGESRMPSSA